MLHITYLMLKGDEVLVLSVNVKLVYERKVMQGAQPLSPTIQTLSFPSLYIAAKEADALGVDIGWV